MPASNLVSELVTVIAADAQGRVFLSNALASITSKLVPPEFVCDFLADLADRRAVLPDRHWSIDAEKVALGRGDGQVRRSGGYMRRAAYDPDSHVDGQTVSTVLSATVFLKYHVDLAALEAEMVSVPTFPPPDLPRARRMMEAITATEGWCPSVQPDAAGVAPQGGWLGMPPSIGRNCWLSSEDLPAAVVDGGEMAVTDFNAFDAETLCEQRGMVPLPMHWYLRYTFPAVTVRQQAGSSLRRPTFADGGSAWFRVHSNEPLAEHHAKLGWGTTVDIRALRNGAVEEAGRPERVTCALPLRELSELHIDIHPPPDRAQQAAVSPREFEERLRRRCDSTELVAEVLALWEHPA